MLFCLSPYCFVARLFEPDVFSMRGPVGESNTTGPVVNFGAMKSSLPQGRMETQRASIRPSSPPLSWIGSPTFRLPLRLRPYGVWTSFPTNPTEYPVIGQCGETRLISFVARASASRRRRQDKRLPDPPDPASALGPSLRKSNRRVSRYLTGSTETLFHVDYTIFTRTLLGATQIRSGLESI